MKNNLYSIYTNSLNAKEIVSNQKLGFFVHAYKHSLLAEKRRVNEIATFTSAFRDITALGLRIAVQ